jgi:4-hydroxy-tetrahydrodipicolinate reductase
MAVALSILGASGKMGKRILQLAQKDPHFHMINLFSRADLSSDPVAPFASCDVAIDFTSHEATRNHLEGAILAKKALVLGTTGHPPETKRAIEEAAKVIPILFSPNFSLGIALCLEAAARLGKTLFGSCTIDILETHHTSKKDRPSGTALALAHAIGNGKGVMENTTTHPRRKDEIVIHSVRSGEVVGEHTLIFESEYERIELKHTAHSRDAFAHGALMGAKFLAKQPPGLHSLKDVYTAHD